MFWCSLLVASVLGIAAGEEDDFDRFRGVDVNTGEYPGMDEDSRTMDVSAYYRMQTGSISDLRRVWTRVTFTDISGNKRGTQKEDVLHNLLSQYNHV
ncbi:hypothetical protein J6590_026620 [Homalodisca vitripennis]|nr:hypothetical protein J6590_026620 [Homalodisca vitripennis]